MGRRGFRWRLRGRSAFDIRIEGWRKLLDSTCTRSIEECGESAVICVSIVVLSVVVLLHRRGWNSRC